MSKKCTTHASVCIIHNESFSKIIKRFTVCQRYWIITRFRGCLSSRRSRRCYIGKYSYFGNLIKKIIYLYS
ncbi:hypothetical protein O3M35_007975 [Rhynocoris fuscipes]|uniref:Uncharacterized protein n=1 Tax=Rhynocoris fuscipes TaxID=488301 RepID=A0AAW1DGI6_9HEMI